MTVRPSAHSDDQPPAARAAPPPKWPNAPWSKREVLTYHRGCFKAMSSSSGGKADHGQVGGMRRFLMLFQSPSHAVRAKVNKVKVVLGVTYIMRSIWLTEKSVARSDDLRRSESFMTAPAYSASSGQRLNLNVGHGWKNIIGPWRGHRHWRWLIQKAMQSFRLSAGLIQTNGSTCQPTDPSSTLTACTLERPLMACSKRW